MVSKQLIVGVLPRARLIEIARDMNIRRLTAAKKQKIVDELSSSRACTKALALESLRLDEPNVVRRDAGPHGDTFKDGSHKDPNGDVIFAYPSSNMRDLGDGRLGENKRWKSGAPQATAPNLAPKEPIIHHLAPAGIVRIVLGSRPLTTRNRRRRDPQAHVREMKA